MGIDNFLQLTFNVNRFIIFLIVKMNIILHFFFFLISFLFNFSQLKHTKIGIT